jgi:hypothetical protein
MTTVIVTGARSLRASVSYHRRLGRYMVRVQSDDATVEFVLGADDVRGLLRELTAEAENALRNAGTRRERT